MRVGSVKSYREPTKYTQLRKNDHYVEDDCTTLKNSLFDFRAETPKSKSMAVDTMSPLAVPWSPKKVISDVNVCSNHNLEV